MTGDDNAAAAAERNVLPRIVVMGVSGSGKSTIGRRLARVLGVPFVDGDDLPPPANVRKMSAGVPLDDADRAPWLRQVGVTLAQSWRSGVVVACSALRRSHRATIARYEPRVFFIHLSLPRSELERRLTERQGHFMPSTLLESQLSVLEDLGEDERGHTIDASGPVRDVVLAAADLASDSTGSPRCEYRSAVPL